ncbi:MAG: bifunctional riboflavin kinase/FAD synthetase [Lachnospiraceae bacterium]|nr:bifunctional riboflavin kinase/FAD synthetase [Lachnospiraceae bacterium]
MRQINTEHFQLPRRTVITLGKFDGLHLGHRKLIHTLQSCKKEELDSVVFTFSVPPASIVQGTRSGQLMTGAERTAALEQAGIDYLISYPCDQKLIHMSAENFICEILVGKCQAAVIVVGTDCHFGYQRRGDVGMLRQYADQYDYQVVVVDKEIDPVSGEEISSTLIKRELLAGNMEHANAMLGYPYSYRGEVVHGKQLGRTLGIPTMNVYPDEEKIVPPAGVYCAKAEIDGCIYKGIANIGYKPTVTEEHRLLLETFLFDFHADVYGKEIAVMLYFFVRAEQKFAGIPELQRQMTADIRSGREYFDRQTDVSDKGEET